jgi:hypothetical protein
MSRTVRVLAVSCLLVLLLAGPVAATTSSPAPGGSFWQWLVELILPGIPDGGQEPPPQGPNGDAGGGLDPNGASVPGVVGEPRAKSGPAMR